MCSVYIFQKLLFGTIINAFLLLASLINYQETLFSSSLRDTNTDFDYIIIGSGTAGALIAHRLSTETNYSIVVLEAGGSGNFLYDIPVLGPLLQTSVYDWQYSTVPQDNACLAMVDRQCKWPAGKITGGSARLNNMIHLRGNISQYVKWFNGLYSPQDIIQQFDYIENTILPVNEIRYLSELSDIVLNAAIELGYPIIDLNKEFKTGFMTSPLNQVNGKRWSTFNNLDKKYVMTHILVEKILFNLHNKAIGVEYNCGDRSCYVKANKGVILSAGSIGSPKILLQSGIGPKQHLHDVGIKPLVDLPVGENLQDHVGTGLDLVLFNNSIDLNAYDILNPFELAKYIFKGSGKHTSPGCEVVGFLNVSTNSSQPNLQFMILPVGLSTDRGSHLKNAVGIKQNVWDQYFAKIYNKQSVTILPILLHPKSKGFVRLKSSNPKDAPLINPNYFSHADDIDLLIKGLKLVKSFVETDSMKNNGAKLNDNLFPGCDNFEFYSNAYLECYIRQLTLTVFHPVGTCKLGSKWSKDSVVDYGFTVHGVKNLFVVDGSVLPSMPSCNVNTVIAMMANIFFDTYFAKSNNIDVCLKLDIFKSAKI